MKKTLLAISVASLFATSAVSATEIYNQDGTKVQISGKLDVQYINGMVKDKAPNNELDNVIKVDDAEFGFTLSHELDNGMTVGGVLKFEAANGANAATATDAYIGVKFAEMGTLSAGYQVTIYDDAGIGTDYEFGPGAHYEQTETGGQQVVKYKFDNDAFYAGVAYMLNNSTAASDDVSVIDGNVGMRFGAFDLAVFAGTLSADDHINKKGQRSGDMFRTSLQGTFAISETLTAGLSYEYADNEFYETSGFGGASIEWAPSAWKYSAGLFSVEEKKQDFGLKKVVKESEIAGYINSTYSFSDNVSVYAEVGLSDADDKEVGYVAGMIATF